jgi:putative ABC transport system substrate-binding protein
VTVFAGHACTRRPALAWIVGLAVAPLLAGAQTRATLPRIGILSFDGAPSATNPDPHLGFGRGLRELGYVEGQNIVIERRYADGRPERLAPMAAELVRLKVDVILAGGPGPREAARQATSTIPIVTMSGADPVREGWAHSLARPGGNVTGLPFFAGPSMFAKRLELLKRAAPTVKRIAYLSRAPAAGHPMWGAETAEAARALGLVLSGIAVDRPEDFDSAFAAMSLQQPDAILATDTPVNLGNRARIGEFAARERLPAIYGLRQFPEAGGLMSYGIHIPDIQRRAAQYVDKILKGAKPGELPIELPTRFELVINLKTAKALGLTIPKVLLLQADEVIQ